MRILTLVALFGVSVNALTIANVADIAKGIVVGALQQEGLGDITQCFSDVENIGEDVYDAVQDFEEHTFDGTKAGLKLLGEAVEEISSALTDCKNIEGDFSKLVQMAAIFKSPWSLAYHIGKDLIVNGVQIYDQINTAITDYHAQQYEPFGEACGKALAMTILGDGNLMPQVDLNAYEVLNGFGAYATQDQQDAESLYSTINGFGDNFMQTLEVTFDVDPFAHHSRKQTQKMIMMLGFNFEFAFGELSKKGALKESVELLRSGLDCMKTITEQQITRDMVFSLSDAVANYRQMEYRNFGGHIGQIAFVQCQKTKVSLLQ